MPHFLTRDTSSQEDPSLFDSLMGMLRTLGIREIAYALSGGGDSGETSIECVVYCDGREETRLPHLPVAIGPAGGISLLDGFLESFAADHPEGDWCNNEGGYGNVTIFPFATDEDAYVECDMTYGEEGDYVDDEDLDPFDLDIPDDLKTEKIAVEIVIDGKARP